MRIGRITAIGLLCSSLFPSAKAATTVPTFNRDVRPIFADNCYACHGPDKNTRKAKLRLDNAEGAYAEKEGRFPILPDKTAESKVIKHITSTDPDEIMTPPKSGKKLTAQQIDTIRRWIEGGAKYERHWSYIVPQRP